MSALLDAALLARSAKHALPVCSPGQEELLALLVRSTELEAHGSAAEQTEHAARLREAAARYAPAPVQPEARSNDPVELIRAINPAEGAWWDGARARHAEYLRAVAEARVGQAVLAPAVQRPGALPLPSTIDRPARQRGLWEAA